MVNDRIRDRDKMPEESTEFGPDTEYDLEYLMKTYGNDCLRTAYMYVKDIHTAEDIFQEVFIKVNRALSSFRGESSIKTWLIRITINACKDYLKSAYSRNVVPMMEFKEDTLVSEDDFVQVEQEETSLEIRAAVEQLPDIYREVVICFYFQEMSLSETAEALHLAEGTIKSRLSRAKEKLKPILERRYGDAF